MDKFKPINGWTKEAILKHIETNFKEYSAKFTMCSYRDGKGNACAIGIFIPENLYNEKFEGYMARELFQNSPSLLSSMPLEVKALGLLQNVHDDISIKDKHLTKGRLLDWVFYHVQD